MDVDLEELERFVVDVRKFSFAHFGSHVDFEAQSRYFTRSIGKAVISLQVYLRDELRVCFLDSIGIVTNFLNYDAARKEIQNLLDYHYFSGDIYNLILANLATVMEMTFCLDALDILYPSYWFPRLWAHIFKYRMHERLQQEGGWRELAVRAQRRYVLSGIYDEMCDIIDTRLRFPYDFVLLHRFERMNLLGDLEPRNMLMIRTPYMKITELSMRMMNCLYFRERMIPYIIFHNLASEIAASHQVMQFIVDFPVERERLI